MPWVSVDDSAGGFLRNAMGVPIPISTTSASEPLRDREFVGHVGQLHHILLALHGLVTRYVTGPLLASSRWMQRKGRDRRPALPRVGPSDRLGGDR